MGKLYGYLVMPSFHTVMMELRIFQGPWAFSSLAIWLYGASHPSSGTVYESSVEAVTPAPTRRQGPLTRPDLLRLGPDVSLQHYCINFSWVQLGERSEQTLWIENQSDCLAHFQFDIDCQESVFSIRPAFGTLAGKTRMTLHCTFQPTHPIICFRRVACLIHHQVSDGEGTRMGIRERPKDEGGPLFSEHLRLSAGAISSLRLSATA